MMPIPKGSSQSQRFVDKARELECDEDEAAFEAKLKKIAKAQPPKHPALVECMRWLEQLYAGDLRKLAKPCRAKGLKTRYAG
jgi:hypothetical protein